MSGRVELHAGVGGAEGVLQDKAYTKVLSVDAAYHFGCRGQFFFEAFRLLRPGGTMVLADLALGQKWRQLGWGTRLALMLAGAAMGIPRENMVSREDYAAELEAAGFDAESIKIVPITEHVLPGFCSFVSNHRRAAAAELVLPGAWSKLRFVAWLWHCAYTPPEPGATGTVAAGTGGAIDFVLVSAKKL
jgi:hypothetical protein